MAVTIEVDEGIAGNTGCRVGVRCQPFFERLQSQPHGLVCFCRRATALTGKELVNPASAKHLYYLRYSGEAKKTWCPFRGAAIRSPRLLPRRHDAGRRSIL